ncbi:MAG: hypothetical protein CYG59_00320 [Chloroflexi bacterium]|nr:MAG: hypothetical protein CYG59_00320 [Chloroflexota bacterium]
MSRGAQRARRIVLAFVALVLTACGGTAGAFSFNTPPTIYDLTQRPQEFAGKEVTAQGYYLWKPGDPATSVLLPGLSTADGTRDAQPIYASVTCEANGECKPSTTTVGEASTGAVWLENFPAEVTADLHRPGDSVWGVVEVTGLFEAAGGYGPNGAYRYRMQVRQAKPLQKVERLVSAVKDEPLGEGKVSIFELARAPEQYRDQTVTSQGYYFWSPATQGMFVERVEREKTPENAEGLAPAPGGVTMGMDGFPADKSGELHVGPNGSFVWGLVEVTGTFQIGSFADGRYQQQIKVDSARVLEQPK